MCTYRNFDAHARDFFIEKRSEFEVATIIPIFYPVSGCGFPIKIGAMQIVRQTVPDLVVWVFRWPTPISGLIDCFVPIALALQSQLDCYQRACPGVHDGRQESSSFLSTTDKRTHSSITRVAICLHISDPVVIFVPIPWRPYRTFLVFHSRGNPKTVNSDQAAAWKWRPATANKCRKCGTLRFPGYLSPNCRRTAKWMLTHSDPHFRPEPPKFLTNLW